MERLTAASLMSQTLTREVKRGLPKVQPEASKNVPNGMDDSYDEQKLKDARRAIGVVALA